MNFLKSIVNKIKNGVRAVLEKVESVIVRTQVVLASSTAENYVDSGLKILIAVVIGALLLTEAGAAKQPSPPSLYGG